MKQLYLCFSKTLTLGLLLAVLVLCAQSGVAQAQETAGPVTVTVTDQDNQPVAGAVVLIKGTTNGKTTDAKGVATISVAAGTELEVRFAGLKAQTVNVRDRKKVDVQMEPDALLAQEVVAIGYGTQKKINLSGAVAVAPTEMLESRPVTNIATALQGTVANLNILNNSGRASDVPNINIRGLTSLSGSSTSPLILVDGIPIDNEEFARLNPNDIKSISVLKDPSTAAIYGARAAFGAILVTTKEGYGAIKVNYTSNYGFRQMGRMPEVVTDPETVMNYANIFSTPWYNLYSEEQIQQARNVKNDPENYKAQYVDKDGNFQNLGQTDWFNEVYNNLGFSTNQALSISGSAKDPKGKLARFLLSADYMHVDGMLRKGNDSFNRYSIRSKVDYEVTKWLRIGNNTYYSEYIDNQPTAMSNYGNGSFFHQVNRTRSLSTPYNVDGSYTEDGASMLGRLENGGRDIQKSQLFRTLFHAKATIFKDIWTVNADASFSKYGQREHQWDVPVYYSTGPNRALVQSGYPKNSYAYNYSSSSQFSVYNLYTNYNQTFNDKHFVAATVGYNQELSKYENFDARRNDLISSSLPSINLATGKTPSVNEGMSDWGTRGAFARLNYIFNKKYIFEVNGRYDGSSKFPHRDRFVFNPSGSLAWVISEEKFFEKAKKTVNLLKLRGSYGSVGNQSVGSYDYIPRMGSGTTSSILDGSQVIYVAAPGLVSSSLTWETITTLDLGIDVNFLNNRLQISGGYYNSNTKGMLTKGETLPSVIGTAVPKENAANLRTRGWELTVTWKDQFMLGRHPFRYDATFVIGDAQTEITKFSNPTGTLKDYYKGMKLGEIWGYETEGFFQSAEEIRNHADQSSVLSYPGTRPLAVGDLKFKDRNGDGYINNGKNTLADPGDRFIIGNATPRYNYSLTLGADWAGIDLRVYFQGVGKRDYYPGTGNHYFWGMYAQPWANLMASNLDHWTPETPDAYFPRPKAYVAESSSAELGMSQTRYLQDASYCRLKNITIGYTFPDKWLEKSGIRGLRLYFSGENLATITNLHKSLDPEGLDGLLYPYQRTYSFGVNFNF